MFHKRKTTLAGTAGQEGFLKLTTSHFNKYKTGATSTTRSNPRSGNMTISMLQKANAVPTKLPNLENVYLKKKITINKNSSALKITLADRNAKLCGICGAKHAPGERHKTKVISP
jgi:hypothetical protein